jgi:soluble lytic murein transglycosylase-like protein
MSKTQPILGLASWGAAVLLVLTTFAAAQQSPIAQSDPFAAIHAELQRASDKALADALGERPWMRSPVPTARTEHNAEPSRVQQVRLAVERVRHLRPLIDPILREEGVPTNLIAVVLIESGGQTAALSPKGARGLWQFMPNTARRYGLAVSQARDERLEITKSSRAAARYLRDLYQKFGDWRLALAAYNVGEQIVEQAVARMGKQDFSSMEHLLPDETRSYVPAVMNAMATLGSDTAPVGSANRFEQSTKNRVLYAWVERTE